MPRSQDKSTTAENLEEKFDRDEDVLDYFDVRKARVVDPQSKSNAKETFAYPVKRSADRGAAVREKSARYRKEVGTARYAGFRSNGAPRVCTADRAHRISL